MKKKVDNRIRTLIENNVKTRHRSMIVLVGDKGREQVVNLHYMLSKAVVRARPSVLWCYKHELHFSSHKKKRMKQIKKRMQNGLMNPEEDDPFAMFVASTTIRYCYYADTHKVLGNTFGMCVLQDFEAMTPNLLARTIETVEGGGIIVFLLSSLDSLSKLYTLTMDVHSRFRTESHQEVVPRFNERFILSLANCRSCLLMDDELNILPTSSHVKYLKAVEDRPKEEEGKKELNELVEALRDTNPAGPLVNCCRTIDQAKAVVTFLDSASEKTLRSTVALTAARGRGKSAALGVAIAGAVAMGYSNIFVTAPSPENLNTLFEFVFKGLDSLGFKEHIDYDLVESTNPQFGKAIVRVNIFRNHRQTIQYVQPQHYERVHQAELLVIDEAAAIPLPLVKKLLGPYLVFLCSTVNGYEGTGRSLSLKLISQLRSQGAKLSNQKGIGSGAGGRLFKEVQLQEPIRYAPADPIEKWLHELLCLNAAEHASHITSRLPHPSECELYHVNRDALFSHHKASEMFLQRMMALYVASHYKNSPNDLQLMSDAPAHRLFALLAPVDQSSNSIPEILAVVQVALEGAISKQSAKANLAQGKAPQGDMIPWTMSQQFQDAEFPTLSGLRVVRIATHPDVTRAGYGTRALQLLVDYYEGKLADLTEEEAAETGYGKEAAAPSAHVQAGALLEETMAPRAELPPLLTTLGERKPERLHWIGTSFGVNSELIRFWSKSKFKPVYIRQTASEVTGEYSCILIRELENGADGMQPGWADAFVDDFRVRFFTFLAGAHRAMDPGLALALLDPKIKFEEENDAKTSPAADLEAVRVMRSDGEPLSPFDMKRLESYAKNIVEHHMIQDLVPAVSRAFFAGKIPVNLSYGQAAILLSVGLQHRDISQVEEALNLPANQILALFNKAIKKMYSFLKSQQVKAMEASMPRIREVKFTPAKVGVDEDLEMAAKETTELMKKKQEALMSALGDLEQYAIKGQDSEWEAALEGKGTPKTGLISVKSNRTKSSEAPVETPNKKTKDKDSKKRTKDSKLGLKSSSKKAKSERS